MSDCIEHDGKKYYEESYVILANSNAQRRGERIAELEAEREAERDQLAADLRMARIDYDRLEGLSEAKDNALAALRAENAAMREALEAFASENWVSIPNRRYVWVGPMDTNPQAFARAALSPDAGQRWRDRTLCTCSSCGCREQIAPTEGFLCGSCAEGCPQTKEWWGRGQRWRDRIEREADIKCDRQFIAGLNAGWSLGVADDRDGMLAAIASHQREIHEALKAGGPVIDLKPGDSVTAHSPYGGGPEEILTVVSVKPWRDKHKITLSNNTKWDSRTLGVWGASNAWPGTSSHPTQPGDAGFIKRRRAKCTVACFNAWDELSNERLFAVAEIIRGHQKEAKMGREVKS